MQVQGHNQTLKNHHTHRYNKQILFKNKFPLKFKPSHFQNKNQMSYYQVDQLQKDNHHKSHQIKQLVTQVQCLKNDLSTSSELTKRLQQEKQQLKNQIKTLKLKIEQNKFEQETTQSRYLAVLQKLEGQLESQKKKFQKLQNKIQPLIDHDSVRLSVLSEVSTAHQLQMEKYKHIIEQQKDQILKLKREKALVQHKCQNLKLQFQEKARKLQSSVRSTHSQNELTAMSLEMSKQIENRLKLSYQTIRKEAQYYKEKYFQGQKKYREKVLALQRELSSLKRNL